MLEQVRVGVIGTSWWTDMIHLPCLKSHPKADIVAVCGRDETRADEIAKKYEIPTVFTDYRKMLEKGKLHAVVIAAPDDLHHQMTMDALDAGLHVLCEKPMACTAKHASEMYQKAESVGVKHMVMFTHRWWPHIQYLHNLIREGYIGRCYHCDISLWWDYAREPRYEWRFDRTRSNGVLGDLGSHMIDWARLFVGNIASVSAHLNNFIEHPGLHGQKLDPANDSALLALEFENGAQGVVHVSYVPYLGNRMFEMNVTLHGKSGTLVTIFSALTAEVHAVQDNKKIFKTKTFPEYLTGDVTNGDISSLFTIFQKLPVGDRLFIDSILDDRPITPNFLDGLRVQEVVDAALQSQKKNSWISIS
jgi:predicted dehydrogenase